MTFTLCMDQKRFSQRVGVRVWGIIPLPVKILHLFFNTNTGNMILGNCSWNKSARILLFFRTALETDLKIEREWRGTLQKSLEEEREKVSAVQTDLQKYKHLEKVVLQKYRLQKYKHLEKYSNIIHTYRNTSI